MYLHLIPFTATHYPAYHSWFDQDPLLRQSLGGVDDEWLHHILTDTKGREYAVLEYDRLVGVVGIELPDETERHITITNLAVHPTDRRRRIGGEILKRLHSMHTQRPGEGWLAYVDEKNIAARRFFEARGWRRSVDSADDSMVRYWR